MKKRYTVLLTLALCAVLLLAVLPGPAAAAKISFISINDLLPPELINCATSYGGSVYVPATVFSGYGLGVGYNYFSASSTAYLYTASQDIFFDIPNGGSYDVEDNHFSASAIFYGGTVYVPLNFTAGLFGISVSYNEGNDYGSILRLTNGAQVLDDAEFLSAASRIMQDYWQAYNSTPEPTEEPSPTPTPATTPRPTAKPVENDHAEDTLRLSFLGLPDAEVLDLLDRLGMKACVFLRAEDVKARADDVRRLACTGWSLGVCCDEDGLVDFEAVDALLFEAARVKTVLVSAPEENVEACRAAAERRGLVYAAADLDAGEIGAEVKEAYPYTQQLELGGDHSLRLSGSAEHLRALEALLSFVRDRKFGLELQRETMTAQ